MVVVGALIAWAVEKSADAILYWVMQELQPKDEDNNDDEEKGDRNQLTPPKT